MKTSTERESRNGEATPRTDAFHKSREGLLDDDFAWLDFARQLERELAEARTIIEAHEAVRDACLEALPECQAWGDVPGWIEQMKSAPSATVRSSSTRTEKL